MSATCSTCCHWRKIRDTDHRPRDGSEVWPGPHGECKVIDHYPDGNKAWVCIERAKGVESHEVAADLITQPDFGCLHHSPLDIPSTKPEDTTS